MEHRQAHEKMVVILDSGYVHKGVTEWSVKWHWHGWRVKSKEVGHRDLWETIIQLRREAGSLVQFVWTPSDMKIKGNDMADSLAEEGRLQRRNNKKRRSAAEPHPVQLWEDVGLCPMQSDVSSSSGGGGGIHRASGVGGGTVQCGGLPDSHRHVRGVDRLLGIGWGERVQCRQFGVQYRCK